MTLQGMHAQSFTKEAHSNVSRDPDSLIYWATGIAGTTLVGTPIVLPTYWNSSVQREWR